MAGTVKVLNPQTGKVEELPAEAAQAEFLAGRRQLVQGDSIPLMDPEDGTVMDFTADKVEKALQSGWGFAPAKDVLRQKAQGQQLQATAEAAASTLSLGTSDLLLRQMGVEGLAERRDTTGGSVGEALGLGAGFFIPGLGEAAGAEALAAKGLARTALDAALMPTAAVAHAGNAVEAIASKALGRVVESEALAKIGGSAVGRAVEGAVYGAGGGLSEEALGNPDMNAESVLAAVGGGVLMGGAVGGALGGGLTTVGQGLGAAGRAIGRKAEKIRLSAEQLSDALSSTGVDVAPGNKWLARFKQMWDEDLPVAIGGHDVEDLRLVRSPKAQETLRKGDQVIEETGRDMVEVMGQMGREQTELGKGAYGGLRQEKLKALLPKGNENQTLESVANHFDQIETRLNEIRENERAWGLGEGGGEKLVKAYRDALDDAQDAIFRKAKVSRKYQVEFEQEHGIYNSENREIARKQAAQDAGTWIPEEVIKAPPMDRFLRVAQEIPPGPRWDARVQELANLTRPEFDGLLQEAKAGGWNQRYNPTTRPLEEDTLRKGKFFPSDDIDTSKLPPIRKTLSREDRTRTLQELASGYEIPPEVIQTAYEKLNNVKQLLAKPGRFEEVVTEAGQRQVQAHFKDLYATAREGLENTALWGEAGTLQKDLNTAYANRAQAWDDLKSVMKFNGDQVDPSAVSSYLSKVGKLRGDRVTELLDQWQSANNKFAEVAHTHFGADTGYLAKAQKLDGEFNGVRKRLTEDVGVFNALKRLNARRNAVSGYSGGVVGSAIGSVLGNVFGLPGIVAGLASQSIIDPGRTAVLRANTAGALDRVNRYISGKTDAIFSGVKKALPSMTAAERTVSRATMRMLEAKTPEDRQKAYRERLAEVQALQDPAQFGEHSAARFGDYQSALPAHADAMTGKAVTAVGLLAAALPPIRGGGMLDLLGGTEPQPHDQDILKFAQVDHVLQNPLSILDRLEKGYLFAHEMAAVQGAYPGLLDQIRRSSIESLGRSGKRPTGAHKRVMTQLLGGATPYLQTASFQSVHKANQLQAPPSGQGGTSPKPKSVRSASMASSADRLDSYPYGS